VTIHAADVLRARARAGRLDPRARDALAAAARAPTLDDAHRRAAADVLAALSARDEETN